MDALWFILIFAGWFALQRWLLPRLGIPTCMSGACTPVERVKTTEAQVQEHQNPTNE